MGGPVAEDAGKNELLALLSGPSVHREKYREAVAALLRKFESMEQARDWFNELARFLPAGPDEHLQDFLRFALLGVCFGFIERELSPYLPEHLAIVPPLLDEVRSVYDQISATSAEYDPEEFRYRAYDYGLHKATYLDWCLYLSHDPY